MSIWSSYPFVRIVVFYSAGIALYNFLDLYLACLLILIFLLTFYGLTLLKNKKHSQIVSVILGLLITSLFFLLGISRAHLQDPTDQPDHLTNLPVREFESVHIRIDGYPVEKENHIIYEATILSGLKATGNPDSVPPLLAPVKGKLSVYFKKDSLIQKLKYGDIIAVLKTPFQLAPPKNPYEFDYSKYMGRKGIYHQLFLQSDEYQIIDNRPKNSLLQISHALRAHFQDMIGRYVERKASRDIALALILGIKDNLDRDLKSAYSSAGAMHVLAVSGLHVGIIHLMAGWLLGFLRKYKFGRYIFMIFTLFFLWGYAFITGLSPSVLRAVIMFSIMLIGNNLLRAHNVYNSLAASAFLILTYNPFMLMEVGFQLSYSAVLGIVYLQPRIYQLLEFKNKLVDKAWGITCVSVAAQVSTFPLGLYYFHQFPTYFLISNLAVIPASFMILLNGIFLLAASFINDRLAEWLGFSLDLLIDLLNRSVLIVNSLPYNLIEGVFLDEPQMILIYMILLMTIMLFHLKKAGYLRLSFICCLIFILVTGFRSFQSQQKNEIVFYEVRDNLVIDLISHGTVNTFLKNKTAKEELINYQIGPNRLACSLPNFHPDQMVEAIPIFQLGKVIFWQGIKILIVDQSMKDINFDEKIETDLLVLSGNHYVDIEILKEHFSCKTLIIDSSYKKYRSSGLSGILRKEGIDHWNINSDGAYIFRLK